MVKLSDLPNLYPVSKRALAIRSLYFRSYLSRFFCPPLEIKCDFVTREAWTAILPYLTQGQDLLLTQDNAYEVLQATNYLQMESAQALAAEFLQSLVTKTDFVTVYNFAVNRGIETLVNYIKSALIRPEEAMRKRKFGQFDLVLKLDQMEYRCHRSVVEKASVSVSEMLARNVEMTQLDAKVLGVGPENSQHLYNMLESLYLGDQVRSGETRCSSSPSDSLNT